MPALKIPPEQAIHLLTGRLDEIAAMRMKQCSVGYYDLVGWCSKTWSVVDEIFGSGDYRAEEIRLIGLPACSCNSPGATLTQIGIYESRLRDYVGQIRAGMTKEE